jgi:hypothetical protein
MHGLVNYLVFHRAGRIPGKVIMKKYLQKFSSDQD